MPRELSQGKPRTPGQIRQLKASMGIDDDTSGAQGPHQTKSVTKASVPFYRLTIRARSRLAALTKRAEDHLKENPSFRKSSGFDILSAFFEEIDSELTEKYEDFLRRNNSLPPD